MNSKETVIEFLTEMTEWEIGYDQKRRLPGYREGDGKVIDAIKHEQMVMSKIILKKYLTDALLISLGLDQCPALTTGKPPIHLQDVEPLYEEKPTKAVIFVSKGAGGMSFPRARYTLKKVNEKWLIDQFHNTRDGIKWTKAKEI